MGFDDLVGMEKIVQRLRVRKIKRKFLRGLHSQTSVLLPLENPAIFKTMGITPPRGILISGASGAGKTSLALALAREARLKVIALDVSDPVIETGTTID